MRERSSEEALYQADTRAYYEFCRDHHLPAKPSEFSLYCWIAELEGEGIPEGDRRRMRASVELLFRRLGILRDDEPSDLEIIGEGQSG